MERNENTSDDPDRLEQIFQTIIEDVDDSMQRIDAVLDTLRVPDDVPSTQAGHTRAPPSTPATGQSTDVVEALDRALESLEAASRHLDTAQAALSEAGGDDPLPQVAINTWNNGAG